MSCKTLIWIAQLSFWVIYSPWRRSCWNLRWNGPLGRKDGLWLLLLAAVGPSFLPPREKFRKVNNFSWTVMVKFLEGISKPQRKTLSQKKENTLEGENVSNSLPFPPLSDSVSYTKDSLSLFLAYNLFLSSICLPLLAFAFKIFVL